MARKLPRFLTLDEFKAMLKAAKNPRDSMLLKCLFYMGLRNSEAVNLKKDNVDVINKSVKVVQGKGSKDRIVFIPNDNLAQELGEYMKNTTISALFPLSDRQIRNIIKTCARVAGIRAPEEVHPHTLRHSYATHLVNKGVGIDVVQDMLGHERLETTKIYTHMGKEQKRKLIEAAFKDI
jgi:integrase/recombinase XerD